MNMLFPPRSIDYLNAVSQIGLLLFMFVVGLKLDTQSLSEKRYTAILTSLSSISCPFVLGLLLASYLHPRVSTSTVPFIPFALFIGTAISVTAFPVLARILSERNLLSTKIGAVAIACAAVDDVTAWILLAATSVSVSAFNKLTGFYVTLASLAVYLGVMWLGLRRGLHWLQSYNRNSGQITQGLMTFILLLLLGSAWGTERLGNSCLVRGILCGCRHA
jgi:Kef-type K+ transport system membrane component KefB